MLFEQLDIVEPILAALRKKGYKTPTPIQQQAIPAILSGRDVIACAQTGTGKTASFSIPVLQKLSHSKRPGVVRGLALVPTRELAIQVSENVTNYGTNLHVRSVLLYGGVPQTKQVKALKSGCDLVIATPGRLMDLIQQRALNLAGLEILVMDEADRMLDMGFIRDVTKILRMIPAPCQRVLLSATMPFEIQQLVSTILKDPIKINIAHVNTAARIEQNVYHVAKSNKRALLKHVISDQQMANVIVFSRTKHGADKIALDLQRAGISAEAFHGNKSQGARYRSLSNFKAKKTRVLVATDIASRGIDINDLPFVINYEMPDTAETYTHRIGRTGRAGNTGTALSFCDHEEAAQLKQINKLHPGKIRVADHPFGNKVQNERPFKKHSYRTSYQG
ncbi:MAG TPA: DEAD/DEAH box helicase [Cyclobacteriaceae bacterium]|nr:DEAD/DEAH box helicase [Cyclobacteriaceae bacterium]